MRQENIEVIVHEEVRSRRTKNKREMVGKMTKTGGCRRGRYGGG